MDIQKEINNVKTYLVPVTVLLAGFVRNLLCLLDFALLGLLDKGERERTNGLKIQIISGIMNVIIDL